LAFGDEVGAHREWVVMSRTNLFEDAGQDWLALQLQNIEALAAVGGRNYSDPAATCKLVPGNAKIRVSVE
jgi:hypothetical protein